MGLLCQGLCGDGRAHSPWLLWVSLSLMAELVQKTYSPHTSLPPLSISGHMQSIQPQCTIDQALMTLPYLLSRELANGCCSFVFKLFWIFSLADLHDFRLTTKRGAEGEGLKYNNFLLPKLSFKILPGLAFLCHLTASSKFLQLSYFPAPEITVQPLNYWSANDLTVI